MVGVKLFSFNHGLGISFRLEYITNINATITINSTAVVNYFDSKRTNMVLLSTVKALYKRCCLIVPLPNPFQFNNHISNVSNVFFFFNNEKIKSGPQNLTNIYQYPMRLVHL